MALGLPSTVSAIALTSHAAVAVLEKYRIDYYCAGSRLFDEVCSEKGLSVAEIQNEIAHAVQSSSDNGHDWNTASLREVIRHIVTTHHEFLRTQLPRTGQQIAGILKFQEIKALDVLREVQKIFSEVARELDLHMHKEEAVLFPLIERYEAAVTSGSRLPPLPFGSIRNPIAMMEAEHENTDAGLRTIRERTRDFSLPEDGGGDVRDLFDQLSAIEADLHQHMHLENNILFPRAIAIESTT